MPENAETEISEIGICLGDDGYLAWFTAESECERVLHAWFDASAGDRATAYCVYRAALDREEAAAQHLQRLREPAEPSCETLVLGEQGVLE
jgi:hypothetical protein